MYHKVSLCAVLKNMSTSLYENLIPFARLIQELVTSISAPASSSFLLLSFLLYLTLFSTCSHPLPHIEKHTHNTYIRKMPVMWSHGFFTRCPGKTKIPLHGIYPYHHIYTIIILLVLLGINYNTNTTICCAHCLVPEQNSMSAALLLLVHHSRLMFRH